MAIRCLVAITVFVLCFGSGGTVRSDDSSSLTSQAGQGSPESALRILEAGFQTGLVPLSELEKVYQSERRTLSESSPHVEYAYALALTKNLQAKEAKAHLKAAADSLSPVIFGAREELIRQEIEAGQYAHSMQMLSAYAREVRRIPPTASNSSEAHRAAVWLGTVIGFLEGPAEAPSEAVALAKAVDRDIQHLLPTLYLADFQTGRQSTEKTYAEMKRELGTAVSQFDIQRGDKLEEIKDQKEELAQRATVVKKSSSDAQKTLREQLSDADGKLSLMEKQFAQSIEAEQRLVAVQMVVETEISRLKQALEHAQDVPNRPAGNANRAFQIGQAINAAEAQYALSVRQQALLLASRFELSKQAQSLVQYRRNLALQSGAAALQSQNQLELMKRWESRLEAKGKKQKRAEAEETPLVARLQRRLTELQTYDSRTLEQRRESFTAQLEAAKSADKPEFDSN